VDLNGYILHVTMRLSLIRLRLVPPPGRAQLYVLTRFRTPSLGRTPTTTRRSTLPALRHLTLRRVSRPALFLRLVLADGVVCGRGFEGVGLSKYVRNTR
jgi:hypothetical protein